MHNITYAYNYTYLITNNINDKKYIGVRSCNVEPHYDIDYMSSSKYMLNAYTEFGIENFTKQILSIYALRSDAVEEEIFLHNLYDVGPHNDKYYNKAKQTSVGFDTTGSKMSSKSLAKRTSTNINKSSEEKEIISNKIS